MDTLRKMRPSVIFASNERHRLAAFEDVDFHVAQFFIDGRELAGIHSNECQLMHKSLMTTWDLSASFWEKSESLFLLF